MKENFFNHALIESPNIKRIIFNYIIIRKEIVLYKKIYQK